MKYERIYIAESGKRMRVWIEGDYYVATPADPDDWAGGCVERVCLLDSDYINRWTPEAQVPA